MSKEQKKLLSKLLAISYSSSLWVTALVLALLQSVLTATRQTSTWLLGKLTPLQLKLKEKYNDSRTTT